MTPLAEARIELGFRSRSAAQAMGLDPSGYARIESGKYSPTRESAELIFDFFGGTIELGLIYQPTHRTYGDYLTTYRRQKIRARGRELYKQISCLQNPRALVDPRRFG